MAVGAGRLDVFLGLDAAEFTKGLSRAELDAIRFQKNLVANAAKIGTAIGAAFSARAIVNFVQGTIDAADHLNDLSKRAGVAVETLGGIGFAASQAGADLEGVADSFGKLNLKIAEAARGEKEASEAFNALGIAVKDAAGQTRSADAIFKDLATAFAEFEDGPEKAALANAVFGKSYQALLPLLADGGEALQENIAYYERFSGTTTETAKAADQFNDTLGKLNLVVGAFGRELARQLLPPLQLVADEFLNIAEKSDLMKVAAEGARDLFVFLADKVANAAANFKIAGITIAEFAAKIEALLSGNLPGSARFDAISTAAREDINRAILDLDRFKKALQNAAAPPVKGIGLETLDAMFAGKPPVGGRPAPRLPSAGGTGVKAAKEEVDKTSEAFARYVEQLARTIGETEELTAVQKVQRDIQQSIGLGLGTLTDQQKEFLLFLAQEADAYKEATRELEIFDQATREFMAKREADQKRLDSLTGRDRARQELADLKLLDEELARNADFLDEYIAATRKLAGFDQDLKDATSAAKELGLTFSSALEDAIVDFTSLRDVLKGLEDDLVRIGTRKLVTERLANWFSQLFSGGGGIGGILGSIFGGQSMVGVFASGSDFVPRDGMAYVHRGERIVPASENAGIAGGAINVTNNFNFADQPTRQTITQIRDEVGRGIEFARRRNG